MSTPPRPPRRLATLAVHAPQSLPPVGAAGERPNAPPLYQTVGWQSVDLAGNEAQAEGAGYFYARYGGPNADAAAGAVARLEGAEDGLCFGSGMAAISALLHAFARPGGAVVAVRTLYGGTLYALEDLSRRLGFTVRWAEAARPESIGPLLDDGASLVLVEALSNPLLRVADLDGLAPACRAAGALLAVDATFVTPMLTRPVERGADLSIHSATKFLGGHGDLSAGVVSGGRAHIEALRAHLRLHGALLDPFAAWLLQRGLRTLPVRMARHVENAAHLARFLDGHARVARVHYPGLSAHPDHALALAQLDGPGPMVAFEVEGGGEGARLVYDRLRLIRRVASLGDLETMVLHPATTSHRKLTPEARAQAGIADGLLRLSVGIEDAADLVDDLEAALGG